MNMRHNRRRRVCVRIGRSARALRQFDNGAIDKRAGNEGAGRVTHEKRRIGIAVVLGQQLVVAVRVLAAGRVLARNGDLFVPRIRRLPAGRQRRFAVIDDHREGTLVNDITCAIHGRAGDGVGSRREGGTVRRVADHRTLAGVGLRRVVDHCTALALVVAEGDIGATELAGRPHPDLGGSAGDAVAVRIYEGDINRVRALATRAGVAEAGRAVRVGDAGAAYAGIGPVGDHEGDGRSHDVIGDAVGADRVDRGANGMDLAE